MTLVSPGTFAKACSELIDQFADNPALADSIVAAVAAGHLTRVSGPVGIKNALKGHGGSHRIKAFLSAWGSHASHLAASDVAAALEAALNSYRLALGRAHLVDAVWTGPELTGSELRRTEAVVNEVVASAKKELLIVGYWLVSNSTQVRSLISLLKQKARAGVRVRFVFDPGEKASGSDNFQALNANWPSGMQESPRNVFSWSEGLTKATSKSREHYCRKLHAKVIVADRIDALVTSANLTHAGFLVNLEMGLRIQGAMAGALVKHFDLLIDVGILEPR